jgi:hypothetical protein
MGSGSSIFVMPTLQKPRVGTSVVAAQGGPAPTADLLDWRRAWLSPIYGCCSLRGIRQPRVALGFSCYTENPAN